MNRIYIYLLVLGCFALPYSCSDAETDSNSDGLPGVISLSTNSGVTGDISRSAIGSFPNNGRIGVIAANYHSNPDSIDWKSYSDIFDIGATANLVSGNSYTFDWDSPKYWPFDNKQLVFLAYSPPINEIGNGYLLDTKGNSVLLRVYDGMPDFMYATANTNHTAYSKTPLQSVNLGEFQHAFSQLTVEVFADPGLNPDVRLTNLSVKTSKRSTSFDLATGTLYEPADEDNFVYNIVTEETQLSSSNPIGKTVFLLPGTEDVTEISIGLKDNVVFTSHDFMMSFFQNVSNNQEPLLLERGKNTTLRIIVKSTNISTEQVDLQGVLSDWNQKGNFNLIIK